MRRTTCLIQIAATATLAATANAQDLRFVEGSTAKVEQLTGDLDRQRGEPTRSRTEERAGVIGTDLGTSFEHDGRLYFLFGDTLGRPGDRDAIAWTDADRPGSISLEFPIEADGKFRPVTIEGVSQAAFEVPTGAISIDGVIHAVYTTDHTPAKTMGRSLLAASRDDGVTFNRIYELSSDKFINVSFLRRGDWIYLFGSGDYRESSVHLARVEPGRIADREALRFYAGSDEMGRPRWVEAEAEAVPIFRHDVVGELSAGFLGPLGRYVLLYNSRGPHGIVLRSSATPWGPWSDPVLIFDPRRDGAYGAFLHLPRSPSHPEDDGLSEPENAATRGDPYGPYLMGRYTEAIADGRCRIYYTMSTWNPYQVVVMRTDLERIAPPSIDPAPVDSARP